MSSTPAIRQDLPPKGGYKPINYLRIPAKTYFNGYTMFAGVTAMMFSAMYIWSFNLKRNIMLSVEDRSTRLAIQPLIQAEKDRAYLKQLRKNRDEEARLMANVPGWVVGTYWGEEIFKTRPKDEWRDVNINEFYAHASELEEKHYLHIHCYH